MYFKDKVIWITGASSGIGEALAYRFAAEGAKLAISSQLPEDLHRVANKCLETCKYCVEIVFDLSDTKGINEITKRVIDHFGQIDFLIHCGGISQRAFASETSIEIDRKIMEINFFGTVALTKSVLPYMLEKKSGHIVAISSITGKFGFPLRSAYSASKHAILGFFDSLRLELFKDKIDVTVFLPGRIKTNISLNSLTRDGKYYGKMDDGQNTGMPADECARQMINAIRKKRKEVLIGNKELLMVYFKRFLPSLFFYLARKIKPT